MVGLTQPYSYSEGELLTSTVDKPHADDKKCNMESAWLTICGLTNWFADQETREVKGGRRGFMAMEDGMNRSSSGTMIILLTAEELPLALDDILQSLHLSHKDPDLQIPAD